MKTGTTHTAKPPKNQELEQVEAELKSEAAAIEKLRLQLSAQGAAADKKQVAEFASRQKAYLDRKIDFEKLKRSKETATPAPAKPEPEPVQKQKSGPAAPAPIKTAPEKAAPAIRETAPRKETARPKIPDVSDAKSSARSTEKSPARWAWWLILAIAAGLIAWLLR